jgi:hypothetical protein
MEQPKPRLVEHLMTFEMNVGDGIVFLYFQVKAGLSSFFSFDMIAGGGAMASGSTIVDSRIQFLLPSIFLR